MTIAPPARPRRVRNEDDIYPSSDGKPMGETDKHIEQMFYCRAALIHFFRDHLNMYVAGNNFIYFEQGNPRAVVSPDCYVVPGVAHHLRDTYKTWQEGNHLPSFVLEITSRKTRRADVVRKRPLYENVLHVPEYVMFDPDGDYLKPRLQMYRMVNGQYQLLLPTEGRIYCEQLGLDMVIEGNRMRFYDPIRSEYLLTYAESQYQIQAEARRVQAQAQRAESEAQRAESEAQRAEAQAQRANAQAQRAEAQAQRADEAEAENARLQAELAALRQQVKQEGNL